MTRHHAGVAHYSGDQRHIVGEIKGPLTYGGYVIATDAEYDPQADRTTVTFAHCRAEDVAVSP